MSGTSSILENAPLSPPWSAVTTTIVQEEAGFERLLPEWEALYDSSSARSLCASPTWLWTWWDAFGRNARGAGTRSRPFILVMRDEEGVLVGVVPFYEEAYSRFSLRLRRLRLIGHFGQGGPYDMTEEPTLVARDGWESRVMSATAEALEPHIRRRRWDLVIVRSNGLSVADDPLTSLQGLGNTGARLRSAVHDGSDRVQMPESWAAYRKLLSKSMRDNLAYYPRLLTRDGHDWQVRIVRASDDLHRAAERLADLHGRRAGSDRGVKHSNHLETPAHRRFLEILIENIGRQDDAFIAELVVGDRVVASQAFLERQGELMVYYSGYEDDWYKYSPLFVIAAHVFREALERGTFRLNFLAAPAAWKRRWHTHSGPPIHRLAITVTSPDAFMRLSLFALRLALFSGDGTLRRMLRSRGRSGAHGTSASSLADVPA